MNKKSKSIKSDEEKLPELPEKYSRIAKTFYKKWFFNCISKGKLTEKDLMLPQEVLKKKIHDLIERTEIVFVKDHRDNILKEADNFFIQKDYDFAKVLYAMFFEHTINRLISIECEKKEIDEKTKNDIIRSIDIHGKLSWLPRILGFPNFNDNYRRIIKKLSDDRNSFIHYKWKSFEEDEVNETNKNNVEEEFNNIKLAIKYIKRYTTIILYRRSKSKFEDKFKKKKADNVN